MNPICLLRLELDDEGRVEIRIFTHTGAQGVATRVGDDASIADRVVAVCMDVSVDPDRRCIFTMHQVFEVRGVAPIEILEIKPTGFKTAVARCVVRDDDRVAVVLISESSLDKSARDLVSIDRVAGLQLTP